MCGHQAGSNGITWEGIPKSPPNLLKQNLHFTSLRSADLKNYYGEKGLTFFPMFLFLFLRRLELRRFQKTDFELILEEII